MEIIYRSNRAPLVFLIVEYSIKNVQLTGQIFYLYRDQNNTDRYNENPYKIEELIPPNTKESDINIKREINKTKDFFIKEYINKVVANPKVPDHFTQINIKEFNPIGYNKETYEYLIEKIDSIKIKEQLTLSKKFHNN